jgi:hypothetical protein
MDREREEKQREREKEMGGFGNKSPAGPLPITAARRFLLVSLRLDFEAMTVSFLGFKELCLVWEVVRWGFSAVVWRSPMKDLRAMEAIICRSWS